MKTKDIKNMKPPNKVPSSVPSYAEELGTRIKQIAVRFGNQRSFSERLGISEQQLYRYINGKNVPSAEIIKEMVEVTSISARWLLLGIDDNRVSDNWEEDFALVPIYNVLLSAGPGAFPDDEQAIGNLAFTRYWLRTRGLQTAHLAATNAKGNSMEPTIRDGDMLLIDTQQRELGQDDIYAIRRDDLLMVKRLQLQFDQGILIISDNPLYEKQSIPTADLDIIGRVVWIGHTL